MDRWERKIGDLAICDPAQAHATYQLRVPLRLLVLPGSDIAISKRSPKVTVRKNQGERERIRDPVSSTLLVPR
jgi:hypothetical protein